MEFEQYKTDRELITKEVHNYIFVIFVIFLLTNIKRTCYTYYIKWR